MASPDPDRARALAAALTATVQSAAWALARYDSEGELCEFITEPQIADTSLTAEALSTETLLQLREGTAPLLAATKIPIAPLRFGLTAIYGRRQRIAGVLVLARNAGDGPFTAGDRSALAASLEPMTDEFQRLCSFEGEQAALSHVEQRSFPAQFVLNDRFEVEWRWVASQADDDVLGAMLAANHHLPPAIDQAVRDAVQGWTDDPQTWREVVTLPLPFIVLRVYPLTRNGGERFIGVHVERYQSRNALRMAVTRFSLSAREVEVLYHLLQGRGSTQIAQALDIAESTVNDHIKRLLAKTRARNRVDLAAKALGWRAPSQSVVSRLKP